MSTIAVKPSSALSILVAHPEIQHSHQLAAGLHEAGLLRLYVHGERLPAETTSAIPKSRRQHACWYQPIRRGITYALPRTWGSRMTYDLLKRYDSWVASSLRKVGCTAVVAYENSALATFQEARRLGMACILDAASVHHTLQTSQNPATNPPFVRERKDKELALTDLVITCSRMARETYIAGGLPPETVQSVSLGADVQQFRSFDIDNVSARRGAVRFCYVGRPDFNKGIDLLAAACRKMRANGHDFTLAIAGFTASADRVLRNEIGEFAEIRPRLPHSELVYFYNDADVFVLPSRFDSFGMVVSEALACGLPVIVTENVGAKDLVRNGVNGWVVPAGDADALAERMAWCAENPEAVRAMAPAARVSADARSWGVYRREVAATIKAFLSNREPDRLPVSFAKARN